MAKNEHSHFMEEFARTQHRVYGYIVTLLPNRDDADDAFQETCVVLWNKWSSWDKNCEYFTWACGVAHNVVRGLRRKKARSDDSVKLDDQLLDQIAAVRLESESLLETRRLALSGCLEKLPDDQRGLIEESYLEGSDRQGIARRLAVSTDALYLRLYRIRRALLDCIDRTIRREELA